MEWTNSQGVKWYLHCKDIIFGRNKIKKTNYFFTHKNTDNPYIGCGIPVGYIVSETPTGMPVLKRL